MKSSKLFQLLSSLQPKEWNELRKYIHSPFFNQHQGVIRLFEVIESFFHHEQQLAEMTREKLFAKVFPDEAFNYQAISDLITYLTRLLEGFIVQQELRQDDFQQQFYYAKQLRKRQLINSFDRKLKKISRQIPMHKTADHQYQHFLLEAEQVSLQDQQKKRGADESFGKMVQHLDRYYFLSRIRFGCGMLNRQDVQGVNFDMSWEKILVRYLENHQREYEDFPLLKIYMCIFRMLENKDEPQFFFQAHNQLEALIDQLPFESLREIYAWMMNYCIRRINTGDNSFLTVLFDLYEKQLAKDIMLEEGFLSPWDYKNIVNLGLKMKKFTWTAQFIQDYKDKIREPFRTVAWTYNMAALYFEKGAYTEALQLLKDVEFEDQYYQLGAKTILLKIYFERQDWEPLFYLLDAFEAYLRRPKQISAYQREIYLNLIRYTRKLAHLKIKLDTTYRMAKPEHLQKFKRKVLRTKKIAQFNWLLEQIQKKSPPH